VSGVRHSSPTPSAESAPPTEGLHATEEGADAVQPLAQSEPPHGIQGTSVATAQSTPPARRVMPRLRAKERLAACCGGLAICCGCKALPTDQLQPRPPTDQLPPGPRPGRRPLGPTTGRPPPALATSQLPPTTATDQPPPVRSIPTSAGASGAILPERITGRLAAARTEARKARRMQMAKRATGKTQISSPTSREAGTLSEIEIIAILSRASPVIGLRGTRRSAATSSQTQSAPLETQAPPRQKARATPAPTT
jgi:hypothetical protein